MSKQNKVAPRTKVDKLKVVLSQDSVKEQFQNALEENSGSFVASLIDLVGSDNYLQKCDPNKVVMEALKAATLKLPINKQLGFAYIVPYDSEPTFIMGYRGLVQLAMRTGQYRFLNADVVYEGELKGSNKLTGNLDLTGEKTSDTIVGYFAYMELLNGFTKCVYWTVDQVKEHGQKYSKSYNSRSSAWQTSFDSMALKTVMRNLLGKYGIMSIEMTTALTSDGDDEYRSAADIRAEIRDNANSEEMDIDESTIDGEYEVVDDAPAGEEPTNDDQLGLDF